MQVHAALRKMFSAKYTALRKMFSAEYAALRKMFGYYLTDKTISVHKKNDAETIIASTSLCMPFSRQYVSYNLALIAADSAS